MPIDPSALLGAAQLQIPNPLELAGKGLTLGNLANQNQLGQLQVQQMQQMQNLYSDPQYLQGFAQMLGLGGGNSGTIMEALQKNPLAASTAIGGLLKMQGEAATRDDLIAKAQKTKLETQQLGLDKLANTAFGFINDPNAQGFQSVVRQMDFLQKVHGFNPTDYGVNVEDLTSGDPARVFGATQQIAGLTTNPETRAKVVNMTFDQWAKKQELGLKAAEANKPVLEKNVAGEQIATTPFAPGAAPRIAPPPAAATIPGFGGPPPGSVPGQGVPMVPPAAQNPPGAPQPGPGTAGASGVPLNDPRAQIALLQKELEAPPDPTNPMESDSTRRAGIQAQIDALARQVPTGQSRTTGAKLDYGVKGNEMVKGATGELNNMVASAQAAPQIQSLVDELRQKEAAGIYSGGIAGTDFFTTLANRLQGAGFLGPEAAQKLANTQAWTADTGNLVAQAIKAWVGAGGRVAAREIDYFKNLKPQLLQTPEGRAQIYQELYNMSGRQQQQASQAGAWMKTHDDLNDFVPTFTPTKMKPIILDQLPPASQNIGKAFRDEKGIWVSDGMQWKLSGPGNPSMAPQVPQ